MVGWLMIFKRLHGLSHRIIRDLQKRDWYWIQRRYFTEHRTQKFDTADILIMLNCCFHLMSSPHSDPMTYLCFLHTNRQNRGTNKYWIWDSCLTYSVLYECRALSFAFWIGRHRSFYELLIIHMEHLDVFAKQN